MDVPALRADDLDDQMFGRNDLSLRLAQQGYVLPRLVQTVPLADRYKPDPRWRPLTHDDPQIAVGASPAVYEMPREQRRCWLR